MVYVVQADTGLTLAETSSKLALLLQYSPLAMIEFNSDFRVTAWNPAAEKLFGYDVTEIIDQKLDCLFPSSDFAFIDRLKTVLRQGTVESISHFYQRPSVDPVWCQWHCVPLTDAQQRIVGVLATIQTSDISIEARGEHNQVQTMLSQAEDVLERTLETDTVELQRIIRKLQQTIRQRNRVLYERNQSKQVLQQSKAVLEQQVQQTSEALQNTQKFLSAILNSLPIPVFVKDSSNLQYLLCNPAAEALIDLPAKKIVGKTDDDLFPTELADQFTQADWSVLGSGKALDISEQTVTMPAAEPQLWHVKKVPIADAKGQIRYLLILREDITERKQAETALKQSEAQLRKQSQVLEKALKELQQTQTQLVHTEKMLALGKLAAGMAHEINNPINFIHGNLKHAQTYVQSLLSLVQLYQRYFPAQPMAIQERIEEIDLDFLKTDLPKLLNSMRSGTDRVREMVLALRNFSRLDEANLKQVDLHEGLDNTLMMLQERLQSATQPVAIEIIKEYSQVPLVECFPGQINQVFMHLLSNALDALEDKNAQNSEPLSHKTESRWIRIRTELLNSEWVAISIADNGPGISEKHQSKVFDPFFTTKPVGKGKGLGLSISYQIVVEQHHGCLCLASIPGQQTEFSIRLPVCRSSY